MTPCVLAIDQGTSSTKAILVDASGHIHAQAQAPLTSHYPQPGWAEQSADDIWQSVQTVITEIGSNIAPIALAIANQRETLVVWDAETHRPIAPAILWQCRRTAADCAALIAQGHTPMVAAATGLAINPLFPASKLAWVMRNIPAAAQLLKQGRLRAGTVDAWLLWNLTQGASFATDPSNASRTQLFNTATLQWDASLCGLFGAPMAALPTPRPSDALFGHTVTSALPKGTAIHAMMGDSHAALYGHGVRKPGLVKATYGTGSSLMTLTDTRKQSLNGLSSTIAWTKGRDTAYAIEGIITVSGQAAAFAATLLGLPDASALSALAQTVPDAQGVTFVPALVGLGAPHWNDQARGTIGGLTHATTPAHIARATFDAIACQIADVFTAMEADCGLPLTTLLADGGASSNGFLMQLQANLLNRPVTRSAVPEIGALGAAAMAFAGMGIATQTPAADPVVFEPDMPEIPRQTILTNWQNAVARVLQP